MRWSPAGTVMSSSTGGNRNRGLEPLADNPSSLFYLYFRCTGRAAAHHWNSVTAYQSISQRGGIIVESYARAGFDIRNAKEELTWEKGRPLQSLTGKSLIS